MLNENEIGTKVGVLEPNTPYISRKYYPLLCQLVLRIYNLDLIYCGQSSRNFPWYLVVRGHPCLINILSYPGEVREGGETLPL